MGGPNDTTEMQTVSYRIRNEAILPVLGAALLMGGIGWHLSRDAGGTLIVCNGVEQAVADLRRFMDELVRFADGHVAAA
jgi:hypothetical protein